MLFISLLLSSGVAMAAPSINCSNLATIQKSANLSDETKGDITASCTELGKLEEKQKEQQAQISKLQTDKKYCGGFWDRASWTVFGQSDEDREKCAKEHKDASDALAKTDREVKALQESTKARLDQFDKKVVAATAESARSQQLKDALKADVDLVNKEYGNARLALADIRLNTAEGREKLARIEKAIDLSVMGRYVKDRMQNLLNSDVLCTAAKACSQNKPRNIHTTDLNSIFQVDASKAETVTPAVNTPAKTKKAKAQN